MLHDEWRTCMQMEHDGHNVSREIGVLWSSSQRGCGPLKKLLREVELSPSLPPATQAQPVLLPGRHGSQSAPSTSTNNAHAVFQTPDASDGRSTRRLRRSVSRENDVFSQEAVPTSSSSLFVGIKRIPSSDILSRVSRTLNEKAMTQYSHSQQQKQASQQKASSQGPKRGPSTTTARILVESTPVRPISVSNPYPGMYSTAGPDSSQPRGLKRARSVTMPNSPPLQRQTSITSSPDKARIRALLETIDSNGSFSAPTTSGGSSTCNYAAEEDDSPSKPALQKKESGSTTQSQAQYPQRRRPALLGMRRPPLLNPAMTAKTKSSAQTKGLTDAFTSPLPGKKPRALSANNSPLREDETIGQLSFSMDRSSQEKTVSSEEAPRKGYRSTSLATTSNQSSQIDVVTKSNESIEDSREVQTMDEDLDVGNVSSDGTSYGSIDIDINAIEEVCKAYDT